MGFRTVASGVDGEGNALAKELGAHVYIDTAVDDAAAVLQRLGVARAILATAPSGDAMGPLVPGLAARGKLIVVGVPQDQMQVSAFPLVFGGRSIYGSLAGTAMDTEYTLAFSVLENIRPKIETVPLDQAADAYARMMQGKAGSAWCWLQRTESRKKHRSTDERLCRKPKENRRLRCVN
jgi:D-arabinose 1-dehydrogenase-like Zn-dependent alcohol dehydrogenase